MGLFNKYRNKVPTKVTAHILDPKNGDHKATWTVGTDVPNDVVSRLADGSDIYVVRAYFSGEMKQMICKREAWLKTKAEIDAC
jgi:hypothetical protein